MKKRGFTLVEMLAVIAVLGVMMVLVVPKIGGSVESKKERLLFLKKNLIGLFLAYHQIYP